ncbi:MAG TPA: glycosyltransferase [Chitinispirillaceae bacterium]|nr:glycosyltransferase [Chitinispirillaceae bacterium]
MIDSPLVSIIIPAYNHESYIEKAIQSVLEQTYTNWEICAIDDCSMDRTAEILQRYATQYKSKIRIKIHSENKGVSCTFSDAILMSRGSFIVPFSSDDLIPPDGIECKINYLLEHHDIDVVLTDFDVIDSNEKIWSGHNKFKIVPQFIRMLDLDCKNVHQELLKGNFIPGGAIMVRLGRISREALQQDTFCPNLSDYDMWLNLSKNFKWSYLPEVTWIYRWTGNNLSANDNPANQTWKVAGQQIYILAKRLACSNDMNYNKTLIRQIKGISNKLDDYYEWYFSPETFRKFVSTVTELVEKGLYAQAIQVYDQGNSQFREAPGIADFDAIILHLRDKLPQVISG